MSSYDLIIVGLGPAGAYLGYCAQARGLKVLGVDRNDQWDATYGGWVDELPDVPLHWRGKPTVRFGGLGRVIEREYAIVDSATWRKQLLTFPVRYGTAEIPSANRVLIDGTEVFADVVVDARGAAIQPNSPVQQALGWFIDSAPNAWMDFAGQTFLYSFDTPRGHLVEETYLATSSVQEWSVLEEQLKRRFPQATPTAVEHVLIPLDSHEAAGPALAFGARAGFVNPITGYSLATSLAMAEPTLNALWGGGALPWRSREFRADRALLRLLSKTLTGLPRQQLHSLLRSLLTLPVYIQRRFLRMGDIRGTLMGMALVFARVDIGTKAGILRALWQRTG